MTNQPAPSPELLGAKVRPSDPRELRYRLSVPAAVDMSHVASVGVFMPPVRSQVFGSCTGHCVVNAGECLHNLTRFQIGERLDPYVVYWDARLRDNFYGEPWGSDTGAYLASAFDVALGGVPRDDLWPTPGSTVDAPPDDVRADAGNQDWILAHQPMFATDSGGFLGGIWTALQNGQPVGLAMAWYNGWFEHHEILSDNLGGFAGYHAICAYAAIPAGMLHSEPLVVIRNSWGGYTDVGQLRTVLPEADAGDVAIPARYFTNGVVIEARAASAEAAPPIPFDDCRTEVGAAHEADERIVLRVRDTYRTQTARNALSKAAREIREQH